MFSTIRALILFGTLWSVGKALFNFAVMSLLSLSTYAIGKYIVLPNFEAIVLPQIPAFIGCAIKTLDAGSTINLIITAIQTRVTIMWFYNHRFRFM